MFALSLYYRWTLAALALLSASVGHSNALLVPDPQAPSHASAPLPQPFWHQCPCVLQYKVYHKGTGVRLATYEEKIHVQSGRLHVSSHFIPNPNIPLLPKEQLVRRSTIEPTSGAAFYQEVRTLSHDQQPLWRLKMQRTGSTVHLEQHAVSKPTSDTSNTLNPSAVLQPLSYADFDTQGLPLFDAQSVGYIFWSNPQWQPSAQSAPKQVRLAWGNKNRIEPLSVELSYTTLQTHKNATSANSPSSAPFIVLKRTNSSGEKVHIAYDPQMGIATSIWFDADIAIYAQLIGMSSASDKTYPLPPVPHMKALP